jgi:hypothetical protein
LADPRVQDVALEMAVDDFVEEIIKTLQNDEVWAV